MEPNLILAPSILSADFACLGAEVTALEAAGADWIHVDVMDGRFVPNITIGPLVVEAIRRHTALPLDVHLMIDSPESYVDDFAQAGADRILVHVEATHHAHRLLDAIRKRGKKAGIVLNPQTDASALRYLIAEADQVLLMTVNPGFGGQSFIREMLPKVEATAKLIREFRPDCVLEVDGGVSVQTIGSLAAAGATAFVAGNAVLAPRITEGRAEVYRERLGALRDAGKARS